MTLLSRLSEPASPRKLAAFRIALGIYVAFLYTSASWWLLFEIGGAPNRLTNTALPASAEAFLDAHLAGPAVVITGVAAVFMALGAHTRIAAWVTFAGFVVSHHYYYRHTHYHDEWPYLWLFLLVMSMAPCADVWSVDAWWRARSSESKKVAWSLAHRWPIEAMIGWFALVYTAAGIAKLMPLRKGVDWLDGPTVHRLVGMRYFDSPIHWLFGRPAFDYGLSWPFTAMALATVVVECGAVVLLFSRRSYPWVYSAIVGMHLVIYLAGVPGFLATSLLSGLLFVPSRWYDAAAQRLATVAQAPFLARAARIWPSGPSRMPAAASGRPYPRRIRHCRDTGNPE